MVSLAAAKRADFLPPPPSAPSASWSTIFPRAWCCLPSADTCRRPPLVGPGRAEEEEARSMKCRQVVVSVCSDRSSTRTNRWPGCGSVVSRDGSLDRMVVACFSVGTCRAEKARLLASVWVEGWGRGRERTERRRSVMASEEDEDTSHMER